MIRIFMIAAASATVLSLSPTAFAQSTGQYGNADEAKAMLRKAITAVKADKTKALDMFIKGEGGFLDRDLYPFCFNISDGKILAVSNPYAKQFLGQDIRTLTDVTGKVYGPEIHGAAQKAEGEITEVSYMFPRPDNPTPVQKVSFVTAAGDVGCGVGYYK
jgi:Single Cache domain 2